MYLSTKFWIDTDKFTKTLDSDHLRRFKEITRLLEKKLKSKGKTLEGI